KELDDVLDLFVAMAKKRFDQRSVLFLAHVRPYHDYRGSILHLWSGLVAFLLLLLSENERDHPGRPLDQFDSSRADHARPSLDDKPRAALVDEVEQDRALGDLNGQLTGMDVRKLAA